MNTKQPIQHEIATKKTSSINNTNNLRCKYNSIGAKYLTSAKHKKHLRGSDMLDLSSQYYKTIALARTYKKTYYVVYKGKIQKLKSVKVQLQHEKIPYRVNTDYTWLVYKIGENIMREKITYTNACLLHNKKDKKQFKHIYN